MKQEIKAVEREISAVVVQTVEEVFNTMFRQPMLAGKKSPFPDPNDVVVSAVKLTNGVVTMDFAFAFDMQLLLQMVSLVFSPEYVKSHPVHEDLACEIANIVCHKVKSFLNQEGYQTEMGFPFIPRDGAGAPQHDQLIHVHFFYRDKDAQRRVGVAVNCVVV